MKNQKKQEKEKANEESNKIKNKHEEEKQKNKNLQKDNEEHAQINRENGERIKEILDILKSYENQDYQIKKKFSDLKPYNSKLNNSKEVN